MYVIIIIIILFFWLGGAGGGAGGIQNKGGGIRSNKGVVFGVYWLFVCKAASGAMKEELMSKEDVVESLMENISENSARLAIVGDVMLQAIAADMTKKSNQTASAVMMTMTREQLSELHGMMDGTNGDKKTTSFRKSVFKEGLAGLVKKGKSITEMKEAMFNITDLILTREFGDENGKIMWKTTLKKEIDKIKDDKLREEAEEAAASRAEANRSPADASMLLMP